MSAVLSRTLSRFIGGLLAVVLVMAGSLMAADAARADEFGTISGTVTDDTGAPVEGIEVVAWSYQADGGYWGWQSAQYTAADGTYSMAGLPAGDYKIQFATASSGSNLVAQWWGGVPDEWSATVLTLTPGGVLRDISPALTRGGSISGTVTEGADGSGTPSDGVDVTAYRYNAAGDYWDWQASGTTAEDGTYFLGGLPAGEYKLQFTPAWWDSGLMPEWWDNAADQWSATPLTLVDGEALTGISPTLSAGGSVSGVVTDDNGTGLENVTVVAYGSEPWDTVGSAITDAAGAYAITGLPAGEYRIEFQTSATTQSVLAEWWDDAADFETATPVAVAAGADATDISPQLAQANSVSGTVTDSTGAPIAGVIAELVSLEGVVPAGAAWTDDTGSYTVRGVPDGDYRVRFSTEHASVDVAGEWWEDAAREEDAVVLSLSEGTHVADISPVLSAGGSIAGTVADESGVPVTDAAVSVYGYDEVAGGFQWLTSTWVDGDGLFTVSGLVPGAYKISVTTGSSELLGEWWRDAPDEESAEVVTVAAGETTAGIDVRLDASGVISGTVTDEHGAPVADVTVIASREDGVGTMASTDVNGAYRIGALRSGDYKVQFTAEWASSEVAGEWWNDVRDRAHATSIAVVEGETVSGVDAQLSAGARIAGTVTGGDGQPLANASVHVYAGDDVDPIGNGWTNEDGTFVVRGLLPGDYRMKVSYWDDRGLLTEWWNNAQTRETADVLEIQSGAVLEGIDLTLAESDGSVLETYDATISGRVVDEAGRPIPGATVGVEDADRPAGDGALIREDGTWSSFQLAAGRYRVYATATIDGQTVTQWWQDAADKESSNVITVAVGEQRTGIDIVVRLPVPPRVDSSAPVISGPPQIGSVLSADPGGWTPGTEFAFQWFVGGEPIDGATSSTYVPTADQLKKRITVEVTGSLDGHSSVTETSEPTAPIVLGRLNSEKPRVSGTSDSIPAAD